MIRPARNAALAALILALPMLSACNSGGGAAPTLDIRDPKSVAAAFTAAYNRQDIQGMVLVSGPEGRRQFANLLKEGKDSPEWSVAFAPTFVDAFHKSKAIEGPRYDPGGSVLLKLADISESEILAMEVVELEGAYYVANILLPSATSFSALSEHPL